MPLEDYIGAPISAIMGAVMGDYYDSRQYNQQERLQNLQIKGSKEMTDYNMSKQLQMWKDTNYSAQRSEMEKANINPGLMYGMKGGGGVTTGNANGSVQGANAPTGGREIQDMMMYSLQAKSQEANIELMKSQAEKNKVEAAKTAGVDTELGQTQILNLKQGTENAKAQEALTRAEEAMKNVQTNLQIKTFEDNVNMIKWATQKAYHEMRLAENEEYVSDATKDTRVKMIETEAIKLTLENILIKAQTGKTRADTQKAYSDIKVNDAQINKWANEIQQKWAEVQQGQTKLNLEGTHLQQEWRKVWNMELETEIKLAYPGIMDVIGSAADNLRQQLSEIFDKNPMNKKRKY